MKGKERYKLNHFMQKKNAKIQSTQVSSPLGVQHAIIQSVFKVLSVETNKNVHPNCVCEKKRGRITWMP